MESFTPVLLYNVQNISEILCLALFYEEQLKTFWFKGERQYGR